MACPGHQAEEVRQETGQTATDLPGTAGGIQAGKLMRFSLFHPFPFTFSAKQTPSSVQISSENERGRRVPEHALLNEPGQTSGAAAV